MRALRTFVPIASALLLAGCPSEKPKQAASTSKPATPAASASGPNQGNQSMAPEPGDLPAPSDVAAAPADAEKSASGLASKVITKGTGTERPEAQDTVKVHYTGWMTNGKMFDSSVKRGSPTEFPLKGVIPGWTEGVQLMVVGEKRRFWIPGKLAYGDSPTPGRPYGTLVFDVELLEIKRGPKPIPAPEDVKAVPSDAQKTPSGLASKVLTKGKGTLHPTADDTVEVHYTGWMTTGEMFDSSVVRGQPAKFPLGRVIKGWTEGVQLMVQGEKRRFWIPADLAYGDTPRRPGGPHGMLVFDVELLGIAQAPKVPPDVKEPPKDAKKTPSGLAYKVIAKGTGQKHPTATSTVEVHYSGWTTDGKMFDSSVVRGEPTSFPLNGVIPGWTEGVQLMVEGEKARFWIPGKLAYGDTPTRPGAPAGMLVFDIELRKILDTPAH
ncbi:MAG TPA: FKBP-type peptidyl-prolyl cis-trans isomerase [Pseudomonadota bacterium]|jgi:peptidylprolyl isomerase|nr:FKBP-type peptidyl-prolyl cis-trans isomerase [Pseudomonadota bacterium]